LTRARILADYVSGGTTAAEFDYLDGVTSSIQTQLDAKSPTTGHASIATLGTVTSGTISTGTVMDDPTMTQGSDATGDVYYRAADGALTRLATGADGTVLTSTGAGAVPAFEAVPAGGLTFIMRAAVSGANTGSTFRNFWSSSYKTYLLIFQDIGHDSSGGEEMRMMWSTDASSDEAGAHYEMGLSGNSSSSGQYDVNQETSTSMKICPNMGPQAGATFNGILTLNGMYDDYFCTLQGPIAWYHGSDYLVTANWAGHYSGNAATNFTGFNLRVGGGSFDTGTITIFGVNES